MPRRMYDCSNQLRYSSRIQYCYFGDPDMITDHTASSTWCTQNNLLRWADTHPVCVVLGLIIWKEFIDIIKHRKNTNLSKYIQ